MGEIPHHHGGIPVRVAEERLTGDLGNDEKIGRYLLRSAGGDDIISYVTKAGNVKHHIIPKQKHHRLLKVHPNLTSLRLKVEFLVNLPNMRFIYGVTPEDFPETDIINNKVRTKNTCHVCELAFNDEKSLKGHLQVHQVGFCEDCNDIYPQNSSVDHKIRCSLNPVLFQCLHCSFESRWSKALTEHVKTFHGPESHECHVCDKMFSSLEKLENHKSNVHGFSFKCQHCAREFQTRGGRNKHIKAHHKEIVTSTGNDATVDSSVSAPRSGLVPAPTPDPGHVCESGCHGCLAAPAPTATPGPGLVPAPAPDPGHVCDSTCHGCHAAPDPNPSPGDDSTLASSSGPDINVSPSPGPHPPMSPDASDNDGDGDDHDDAQNQGNAQYTYMCHACNFKSKSQKKMISHFKENHSDKRSRTGFKCLFCDNTYSYGSSLKRHMRESCNFTPGKQKRLTEAMLWEAVSNVAISNNSAYTFLTSLSTQLGFKFYPKYLRKVLSNSLNCFRNYLEVETLRFKEGDGQDCQDETTFVFVKDLKKLIDEVCVGRGITNPHLNVGVDGTKDKLVIVLQVYDMDETGTDKEKYKALGCRRAIVIGRGDYVGENRDNVEYMFQKLKIFETLQHYKSSQIISDLKMANILTGIDRHNCKHSCYICDGLKDLKTGRWIVGDFRTTFTAIRDHNGFVASGENKRTAMDSNNQIREPIILTSDLNKPFYQFIALDPLHLFKLGVINDVYSNLQERYPDIMRDYFIKVKAKRERSNMPGLKFNGKQIDHLLKEENLELLKEHLARGGHGDLAEATVKYLKCLQRMHRMCVSTTPWLNYEDECREFRRQFDDMVDNWQLVHETVKGHIIYSHLEMVLKFNMENNNVSLFLSDTNGLESCHSALRRSDERHSCKIVHVQGDKIHEEYSLRSVAFYNARSLGFLPEKIMMETDDNDLDDGPDVTDDWNLESSGVLNRIDDENCVLQVLGGQEQPPPLPLLTLDEHIATRGLSLMKRRLTKTDGNCWFDGLDDLLELNPISGVPRGHLRIRSYVCDRVMALPFTSSWITNFFRNSRNAFLHYLDKMKRSGTYTDDFGIITLATSLILGNKYF